MTFGGDDFVESSISSSHHSKSRHDSFSSRHSAASSSSSSHSKVSGSHRHVRSHKKIDQTKSIFEDESVQIPSSSGAASLLEKPSQKKVLNHVPIQVEQPRVKYNMDLRLNPVNYEPTAKANMQTSVIKMRHHSKHKKFHFEHKTYARERLQTMPTNDANANYVNFIEEQKMKLRHIQKSANMSRQLRALRESQQVEMKYETVADNFDEVERFLNLGSPAKSSK